MENIETILHSEKGTKITKWIRLIVKGLAGHPSCN